MNTQSIDISLYQKGDIALEDIYKKFKNCFMRYARARCYLVNFMLKM